MRFVHLHTHTHYSLLDGLTRIDELVMRVKETGMTACAITDHGSMYGVIEFYQKAKKEGIKPIIGCEMYVTANMHEKTSGGRERDYYHLVLLAENDEGYRNLVQLVTKAHLEGFYYKPRVDKKLLRQHARGLIALSACLGGEISRAIMSSQPERARELALEYQDIFGVGNFFIELQQHPHIEEQNICTPKLVTLARETGIPMVATQDSHYLRSEDAHAHDVLLAVQTGSTIDDKDRLSLRHDDFSLLPPEAMAEKFKGLEEALENTARIAERCNVNIEFGKNQLPQYPLPEGSTPESYLLELCHRGLIDRYGTEISPAIKERLEYELGVINKMGFASYFLIVQDYVNWAKHNGVITGPGRGSAAGSLVSYLLRITNIDPIKYNLLFERFLNPERVSMPDIDVDFDDARRGDVFNYVRQKYGSDHFAQIITFGTMAARGSVRDAGRALGLPYELCDRLAKLVPFNPNQGRKKGELATAAEEVVELKQLCATNPDAKRIIEAAVQLEGVARHCSTHACAVVIAPKPLTEYLPLQKGTHEGDIITQYEMHAVEALGLLKMDFLGLSNLTIIEKTLALIKKNYGLDINLDTIPLDDKKTFQLFKAAATTGVFQLESAGMKRYLKALKPNDFEDIIVMISLYRPGPLDAGMVEEYIERKHGRKAVTYLLPTLEPILKNTYGIIVYQEQLMQIANNIAGFSLGQGYMLIKAVGKKIKSLLDEQREKFVTGTIANGVAPATAAKLWDFIEPFARYGFNKSHAACYAMIGYQTAYLKANFPIEFMTALLNSSADDIERIAFLIEECQAMGIAVLPPDVNESQEAFSVATTLTQAQAKIRFGLAAIKNVGAGVVSQIIVERDSGGPFKNVEDFVGRIHSKDMNRKLLEALIKAGALDSLGERAALLASIEQLLDYAKETRTAAAGNQISLFSAFSGPQLASLRLKEVVPASRATRLIWEKELLGLYISDHPLKDFQVELGKHNDLQRIQDVSKRHGGKAKIGGIVTKSQKIITKTGRPMMFSWLEDLTSKIEVVVFPNVFEKNPEAFNENAVLVVEGKLSDKDGVAKILCDTVQSIGTLV